MSHPTKTAIFIQDECYKHSWIRTRDSSHIYERPERLRAVKLGLAAAIAHIEELLSRHSEIKPEPEAADDLAAALEQMNLVSTENSLPVSVILSSASLKLLSDPAVKFIHGDIDGDVYLEQLVKWASESRDKIAAGGSEIPEGFNQGDMYRELHIILNLIRLICRAAVCPESIDAMQGAVGTTCEAVDVVLNDEPICRAFVSVRPPGS